MRGNVMTLGMWFTNRAQLIEKSNIFLMQMLKKLSKEHKLPKVENITLHGNRLYKIKSSKPLLKYFIKNYIPKLLNKVNDLILLPKLLVGQ